MSSQLPTSVTDLRINLMGLVTLLVAGAWVVLVRRDLPQVDAAAFLMAVTAAPIVVADLLLRQVHRTEAGGIAWSRPPQPDVGRVATKLLGLAGCFGLVGFAYTFTPEYQGSFYERYLVFLWRYGPPALALGLGYFVWLDARLAQPRDAYWQLGSLLRGRTAHADLYRIGDLLKGWVIKGFFVPLMFTYMCNNVGELRRLTSAGSMSWVQWYDTIYSLSFLVDVTFTTVGYLLTLRILDTHIRSSQPRMVGWVVAMLCYEPFFSLINHQYIFYEDGLMWGAWLADVPALKVIWGAGILLLVMGFAFSTITFGVRFSNLTHRGVITGGLYRYTKHPAYITKCVSFWMTFVPFIYDGSWYAVMRDCTWLSALCWVYWMRARTEEQHLSEDPDYVRYALWMNDHGMFAFVGRWIPFLRYQPPTEP